MARVQGNKDDWSTYEFNDKKTHKNWNLKTVGERTTYSTNVATSPLQGGG